MTQITPDTRVRLKHPEKWRDIGTRHGTVIRIDGWTVVAFDRIPGEVRIDADELEVVE
jgi:hypothetical protein